MNSSNNSCPCCGNPLLRHARQGGMYWFCTSCWQEVPILAVSKLPVSESVVKRSQPKQIVKSGIEA